MLEGTAQEEQALLQQTSQTTSVKGADETQNQDAPQTAATD